MSVFSFCRCFNSIFERFFGVYFYFVLGAMGGGSYCICVYCVFVKLRVFLIFRFFSFFRRWIVCVRMVVILVVLFFGKRRGRSLVRWCYFFSGCA